MTQDYLRRMTLLVATSGDEAAMVSPVRDRLTAATGSSGIEVTTLTAYLGRVALAPERLATTLVATLAVLALLLGTIGVQSALAESARQRRRDLALRMALGAQGRTLVRQLVGEGLRLAAAGALLGTIGSMLAARWLARIAPGAGLPTLWMSLGAAAIVLAAVGLATIVPARLVLTVDPLTIARR
jgi:ABC-type antimicrobial peptide transport system permease subunit